MAADPAIGNIITLNLTEGIVGGIQVIPLRVVIRYIETFGFRSASLLAVEQTTFPVPIPLPQVIRPGATLEFRLPIPERGKLPFRTIRGKLPLFIFDFGFRPNADGEPAAELIYTPWGQGSKTPNWTGDIQGGPDRSLNPPIPEPIFFGVLYDRLVAGEAPSPISVTVEFALVPRVSGDIGVPSMYIRTVAGIDLPTPIAMNWVSSAPGEGWGYTTVSLLGDDWWSNVIDKEKLPKDFLGISSISIWVVEDLDRVAGGPKGGDVRIALPGGKQIVLAPALADTQPE